MIFEEAEWRQIVDTLISLTKRGVLRWKRESSDDESWVEARVDDVDYVVGSIDMDDRPPYFLNVWSFGDNSLIARLESEPEPDSDEWGNYARRAPHLIAELRALAYRSADGAPQLFSRLIGKLRSVGEEELPF